jgi:hypothetical protein
VEKRPEANEIILINSHDGASSYQMLAGVFRFVCCNGLVVGDVANDIRIPHKGDVRDEVIEGAFRVLDDFESIDGSMHEMKSTSIGTAEQSAFATAALELRYEPSSLGGYTADHARPTSRGASPRRHRLDAVAHVPPSAGEPHPRRAQREDKHRARMRTRPIEAIDRSIALNRALWILAEEMRRILH